MNTQQRKVLVLILFSSLFLVGVVLAAPTVITLERTVFSGGGGHSESGAYSLEGTIGQPVTGTGNGGDYELCSGFWCDFASHIIYLPLIQNP